MADPNLQIKISAIEQKLTEIRKLRQELNPQNSVKKMVPKNPYKPQLKHKLYHPQLEYIYGEILNSPYMTAPLDAYPKSTFSSHEELKLLKQEGFKFSEIPPDRIPYNPKEMRKLFVKEVINYNPSFSITEIHAIKSVGNSKSIPSPAFSAAGNGSRPVSSSGKKHIQTAAISSNKSKGERKLSPKSQAQDTVDDETKSMYSLFAPSTKAKPNNKFKLNNKNVRLADGLKPPKNLPIISSDELRAGNDHLLSKDTTGNIEAIVNENDEIEIETTPVVVKTSAFLTDDIAIIDPIENTVEPSVVVNANEESDYNDLPYDRDNQEIQDLVIQDFMNEIDIEQNNTDELFEDGDGDFESADLNTFNVESSNDNYNDDNEEAPVEAEVVRQSDSDDNQRSNNQEPLSPSVAGDILYDEESFEYENSPENSPEKKFNANIELDEATVANDKEDEETANVVPVPLSVLISNADPVSYDAYDDNSFEPDNNSHDEFYSPGKESVVSENYYDQESFEPDNVSKLSGSVAVADPDPDVMSTCDNTYEAESFEFES